MTAPALLVAYDDDLLAWQLGRGHPTNPVRAKLAVDALRESGETIDVVPITWQLSDELGLVHTPHYVEETLGSGRNSEWTGERPDLAAVAAHMFAGTVQLAHAIEAGAATIAFSPQGAKHHAMPDRGSGFCVFNDMAWAATHFTGRGRRVLYVDLDAHHGDGVEAVTEDNSLVMTCSVHDSTIFPGTGLRSDVPKHVHNFPLSRGAGDVELARAVNAIEALAAQWRPDVVLIAIGADGHETDPLSSLQYTYRGYADAGGRWRDVRIVGCAGPDGWRWWLPAHVAHPARVGVLRGDAEHGILEPNGPARCNCARREDVRMSDVLESMHTRRAGVLHV